MMYRMGAALLLQVLAYVHLVVVHGIGFTSVQFSGQFYKDFKLSVLGNPFAVIKIIASLDFHVTLRCARICAQTEQCQAFNFYKNETASFCEMLPANTRMNSTQIAHVPYSGATIWEKMSSIGMKPFLDEKLADVISTNYCETIRPGCRGTWPNCNDCVKSCIDCYARNNSVDSYTCTMWPGPTAEENTPITTTCYRKFTHLMRRTVDLSNGKITDDFTMPFRDMNRLCRLKAYSTLQFYFQDASGSSYTALYINPYITENGTIMNLKFQSSSHSDGLFLGSGTLPPTPFVTVNDDKYNCGSYWLFDRNNATHCPGGRVGVFGTPKLAASGNVIDSGIHWPSATSAGKLLKRTDLALYMQ